ncbi:hypothetical protein [Paraburkholderia sp. BCC1886]|uniref:hypothetical protein n=1 Tax=Paraburkholderia sp. BCC1886 TaxID=2562670 RepID=UPI0011844B36|nr:hypothetical protein [Paraburkholderia sp. BCC1886]
MLRDKITNAFSDICGLHVWQVRKGVGSFITMEYGYPHLQISEPHLSRSASPDVRELANRRRVIVSGRWHLWIHMCNWTICSNGVWLADNEASDGAINDALQHLDGQILLSVEVVPQNVKTVFRFDLGGELATWPYLNEGERSDEQWLLYDYESKKVETLKGDGTWCRESLDA